MKAGRYLTAALAALALLPVVYVAAYLALVEPMELLWSRGRFATYRYGGETAKQFFAPIHHVDRYLRPALWEGE
jgi:hypothetical protein